MEEKNKSLKLNIAGQEVRLPIDRQNEFLDTENVGRDGTAGSLSWRILKIQSEFVKGHDFLSKFGKSVSIFGSARQGFDDTVYQEAEKLAKKLADNGFAVFSGGGPGIMEAANKGASQSDVGKSVGININLPGHEHGGITERKNQYIDEAESFDFFFSRKVILSFASQFYIFFPGGFGTLDELFEMLTLIQTGKTSPIPVILVNKDYWGPLVGWIKNTIYEKNNAISEEDLDLFHLVDTAEEACAIIQSCSSEE